MNRCIVIISFVMLLSAGGWNNDLVDGMVKGMSGGEKQVYYDAVTGEQVSQAKYYGNELCDCIKRISPYVYSVSIGIGILLLVLIQNSGKIKRVAIKGFIVGIPLTWYGMAYFLISFMVDHFIK